MRKLQLFVLFFISLSAFADEGMWVPSLLKSLNESDLKTKGLKIPVEEIYSVNQSSIKDAIVLFGGGCTAEVISDQGLILTNHHCGYSQIQAHSSLEKDYLKNGFWAMTRAEELPNPGLTATFIVRMEDVTGQVMKDVDVSVTANVKLQIQKNMDAIKLAAVKGTHYEAVIKPFNYGNSYFLIVSETFKDVRMVGVPPSSIGKFGGDTDNWIWPRHTGDFSIFRIYANKENKPADYSPDNVPFIPRYSLPVSAMGVNENDFAMVYGFPGRTQQYLTSYAVELILEKLNPAKIKMRETSLAIIDADMRSSDLIRIQYSAKQSRISNAYKKWIGESAGLKAYRAVEKKKDLEKEYQRLAESNPEWNRKYGNILGSMKNLYASLEKYAIGYDYYNELVNYGPEFIGYAQDYWLLAEDPEMLKKKEEVEKLKGSIDYYFKNYNVATDKKLFKAMFPLYISGTPKDLLPDYIATLEKKYKGDWNKYADEIFMQSVFVDHKKMTELMKNVSSSTVSKIKKDPAYLLMKGLQEGFENKILPEYRLQMFVGVESWMSKYVQGLMEMMPDKKYWYDANSTLRLAYGNAQGSSPHDGMQYTYYTTLSGMMQKYKPGDTEFDLPSKLVELEKNKDYGTWASNDGLRVCFTTSSQTTGGNSGSPVLDANGYLIGINFDRSWESTMSDIMFDPSRCRNIALDIRYVLFIIEKFAGAEHLLREMNIITSEKLQQIKEEKDAEEIAALTEKIRAQPDNFSLLVERGKKYLSMEMCDDAKLDAKSALKIKPNDVSVIQLNAEIKMQEDNYTEALKDWEKIILANALDANAWFNKAVCQSELKKTEEAIKSYTRCISINNRDHRAYYNRGICYYIVNKTIEGCADMMVAEKLGGERESWMRKELCE
ncbi:MAG: S46 family peptidase [Bacteroidota bacterium]